MRFRHRRAFALFATMAAIVIAGCGGGGKSSLPATPAQHLGTKVPVTFTVTIGTPPSTQSSVRKPAYVPTTTQSLVIEYIGATSASATPSGTPPSNATVAATVNVTTSGTNPPPAGQCFNNAGSYICTVNAQLPVGIVDLYILAYTGQNGTGSLLASSVTVTQVNADASLTQPGTTTPLTITTLGAILGSMTLNAIAAIVPLSMPNPSVAAASYPSNAGPNVYSAAGTAAFTATDGSTISGNVAISPVTITDTENGGATCLVYLPQGAGTATPCPFASATSSITLNNASDSYAVLYNGRFVPGAKVTITAAGPSPAPSPLAVSITPTTFSTGTVSFNNNGPIGALVYDPIGKMVYAGMFSSSTPLYAIPYTASGYGTPTGVTVTSLNGAPASTLSATNCNRGGSCSGGVDDMMIGPDGNVWIAEHNGKGSLQYVAVAVINAAAVNPAGPSGATIQPGPGVFAEYQVGGPSSNLNGASPLRAMTSMGGFIWVMDRDGELWRIDPSTGRVNPNLAAGYLPGQTITDAGRIMDPGQTTFISGGPPGTDTGEMLDSGLAAIGGALYIANIKYASLDALAVDTSAVPSAGICTTPGPPPCIATYQRLLFGNVLHANQGSTTDGTSVYFAASTGQVEIVTPPSTHVTSASAFTNVSTQYYGGIGMQPDGWFWTLASTGVQGLQGISSSAAPVVPAAVTACDSQSQLRRGSRPVITGPDGTLLFSPNTSRGTSGAAVLCAVVY